MPTETIQIVSRSIESPYDRCDRVHCRFAKQRVGGYYYGGS